MNIIRLGSQFQQFADNKSVIEVQGDTIKQNLESLVSLYPVFKELLFDAEETLSALVMVDGNTIVPKNINQPVLPQQEIIVLPMVQGG